MLPDLGSCEERYSLTGNALGLASALLAVGLGFLWHTHLIFAALTVLLAIPAAVLRPVALRVDHVGISHAGLARQASGAADRRSSQLPVLTSWGSCGRTAEQAGGS